MQFFRQFLILVVSLLAGKLLFAATDLTRPVIDQTHTLSITEVKTLSQELWQWHDQGIMQGAVVIVKNTAGKDIFDYGMSIFERWKLGNKESDNGLLIVVAKEDRKIRIITGYGLEGVLPDLSIKRIIDQDITPQFKRNAYFQGLNAGLQAIIKQITADPETREKMIAADKMSKAEQEQQELIGGIFDVFIIVFNLLFNALLNKIKVLKQKSHLRFLYSFLAVTGLGAGVVWLYGVELAVIVPACIMAIIIGLVATSKSNANFIPNSGGHSFSSDRFSNNNNRRRSYRGGGGSSGGGGAGGSW